MNNHFTNNQKSKLSNMLTRKEVINCLGMNDKSFLEIRKKNKIHEPEIIDRKHFYKAEWIREFFETKGKEVHGDKNNYEYVIFDSSTIKVTIECRLHGFFKIEPRYHFEIKGHNSLMYQKPRGCPQCDTDKAAKLCLEEAEEDTSALETLYQQLKYSKNKIEQYRFAMHIAKLERIKTLKVLIPTIKDYVKDNNRLGVQNLLGQTLHKKYDMLLKYNLNYPDDKLWTVFRDEGLMALYDKSLIIQPARKEKVNPLNVVYIWEALDFKSDYKVIKIGTSRDYRGMDRITEVAETWNTRYKLLYYNIVDEPLKLEAQLLHLGKKYFFDKRLPDGATEFRVVNEIEMTKIDSMMVEEFDTLR